MGAKDLVTTTILVPFHDGLTSGDSNKLPDIGIVDKIDKYNTGNAKKMAVLNRDFEVSLITTDKNNNTTTTHVGFCQSIMGLSVSRDVEKRSAGGEYLYQMKLPGYISYNEVVLSHLYTNSSVFLDWMFNGAEQGGALYADIEIKVGKSKKSDGSYKVGDVVYTLRDAFPIKWRLGNISVFNIDIVTKRKGMSVKSGDIPLEEITLVYGRLDHKVAS